VLRVGRAVQRQHARFEFYRLPLARRSGQLPLYADARPRRDAGHHIRRDYPVLQGFILFIAIVYSLINLVVDVSYGVIDPRVRAG